MRGDPIDCGYYSEVSSCGTTTSCRSFPLTLRGLLGLVIGLMLLLSASLTMRALALSNDALRPSPLFPLEPAWTIDLGVAPATAPVFDGTHAYLSLRDDTLRAIRLDDGGEAWSVEQTTTFGPAVSGNIVVVSEGPTVRAYLAADGRPLWKTDVGGSVTAPLLCVAGWLITALDTGEVVAIRSADGVELWRLPLDGDLVEPPSIAGGELFVPVADGRIVAVDLSSGTRLWERKLGGSPQQILPLDALFVGADDNYFYRLARRTGRVEWKWRNGGDVVGIAAVDERRLYVVSLDNILRSLDRRSGVQQWRTVLTGRPTSSPLKVGTLILVAGVAPVVRLFEAETGDQAGTYEAAGDLAASPYIVPTLPEDGPRMVVVTGDGRMVGLRLGRGPEQFAMSWPPAPLLPQPELLTLADVLPFMPLDDEADDVAATLALNDDDDRSPRSAVAETPLPTLAGAGGRFSVQVAALGRESSARTLAEFLVEGGHDAFVVSPEPGEVGSLFRVHVGRRLTRTAATQLATRLQRDEALDTVVVGTR